MKQQMLEQEVKELKHQATLDLITVESLREYVKELKAVIRRQTRRMDEMHQEIDTLRATKPETVGLAPSGASPDRGLVNGKDNGFVRPVLFNAIMCYPYGNQL